MLSKLTCRYGGKTEEQANHSDLLQLSQILMYAACDLRGDQSTSGLQPVSATRRNIFKHCVNIATPEAISMIDVKVGKNDDGPGPLA